MRIAWFLPIIALFFLVPIVVFVTSFNTPLDARAELRSVLNLERLPTSVTNLHIGDDIWTDYIVHIYCELDPLDFPAMISAIPFQKDVLETPYTISPPDYAPMPLFDAEETYYISDGALTKCMIWTTKEHDRMYVYYGGD